MEIYGIWMENIHIMELIVSYLGGLLRTQLVVRWNSHTFPVKYFIDEISGLEIVYTLLLNYKFLKLNIFKVT